MRIIQITPGSGDFYCENCLRDHILTKALRNLKHDAVLLPMYLPIRSDEPVTEHAGRTFFGGINVYLQQKFYLFRKTPAWIDRILDSRNILEWAASKSGMIRAKDLGETTLSILMGREGKQAKELIKLVNWLAAEEPFDVICLSNALLAGLASSIKENFNIPVVCFLQDEDVWLDALQEPYRSQVWNLLSENITHIDAFIVVSDYYRKVLEKRLGIPPERISVVHTGIEPVGYAPAPSEPQTPVIGYLSPMCEDKGLGLLVDAFVLLKSEYRVSEKLKLRIAGGYTADNKPFLKQIKKRLRVSCLINDVEILPNLNRHQKQDFLKTLSVLSVPTLKPEAFGLFLLEALASGVPVVAPRHGGFTEIVEATGGGLICQPNDVHSLTDALARLLTDRPYANRLALEGRKAVLENFTSKRMAQKIIRVFEKVTG